MSNKPIWTVDQIAHQLTHGFWSKSSVGGGRSFDVDPGGTLSVNLSALAAPGRAAALQALDVWTDVTGIRFVTTDGWPDIRFDDAYSGAYASMSVRSNGEITYASVNIHERWSGGPYLVQTYIHEIGHALGLGHAGNYNGTGSFATDAAYANDTWQMSVMSYFDQGRSPVTGSRLTYLETPMLADVLAVHNLYGRPDNVRTGNTVYGDGSTAGRGMDLAGDRARTIVDSGGIDTIDLGLRSAAQRIDLNEGAFSDVSGRAGNLAIARGTVIENAIVGSGDDEVIGNDAGNRIVLGRGDDVARGGGGNDTIDGGLGDDTIDGGSGIDVAVFSGKAASYTVALSAGRLMVRGADGTDMLRSVETLRFADRSVDVAAIVGELGGASGSADLGTVIAAIETPVTVVRPAPPPPPAPPKADGGPSGKDDASAPVPPKPVAPKPGDAARGMEVGRAEIDRDAADEGWVRISFDKAILDPVVVLGPLSHEGGEAVVLQVRGVSATGFDVRLQEFAYLDGNHKDETFSWMAGTRGAHALRDGTTVVFGSTGMDRPNAARSVEFGTDLDAPLFFGTLHGGGPHTPMLRVGRVDDGGAEVLMQVEEGFAGPRNVSRALDWVAIEPGTGAVVTTGTVKAGHVAARIDHDRAEALFADMQTMNGGDPATVRFDRSGNGTSLFVAEEKSADSETSHAHETIGWAGLATGRHALAEVPLREMERPAQETGMEVGMVTIDRAEGSDGWVRVAFSREIADAVVVVGPVGAADEDFVTAQVRNVDATGFEIRLNEWDFQDDVHRPETLTWVAGSLGRHVTEDGVAVAFGQASIDATGRTYDLADGAPDGAVFGTVFGDGEDAVALRVSAVGGGSFEARIEAEEGLGRAPDGVRSLGWLSVEAEAVSTRPVGHDDVAVDLDAGSPFLAAMQTGNGGNPAVLRYEEAPDGRLVLRVEEERSYDEEIAHAAEGVAWLDLEAGWSALRSADPAHDLGAHDHAHDHHVHGSAQPDCCACGCGADIDAAWVAAQAATRDGGPSGAEADAFDFITS